MTVQSRIFYFLLLSSIQKAIVFDEMLRKRLTRLGRKQDITVIPLAVEPIPTRTTKEQARKVLGIQKNKFVLLAFGFLAWYKGTDWLANTWKSDDTLQLIIAGGHNPNRWEYPYYRTYIQNIQELCMKKGITLTGFVPENKMPLYFIAADLIIFPYRTIISTSYPLALAFTFRKPILLSRNMSAVFLTKDIQQQLAADALQSQTMLFPLNGSFHKHITALRNNSSLGKKLATFSQSMNKRRSWENIQQQYYQTLFG